MSVSLHIDLDQNGLSIDDLLAPKIVGAVQSALVTSLAVVQDKWQSLAQQKLKSSRPLYLMGLDFNSVIYPFGGDSFSGAVELFGKFPNMLENGFSAFDIKSGFQKSSKKTVTKNGGWYLTIPIRHSTPGAFMYGNSMTKDIYSQARKLADNESLSVKGGADQSWTGYQHKTNINDGLTRIVKTYSGGTKQSQYVTFRRVSNNSDSSSWQHPGFVGVKIADELASFAMDTLAKNLDRSLQGIKL